MCSRGLNVCFFSNQVEPAASWSRERSETPARTTRSDWRRSSLYYFFLALFPALLFLLALSSFFPIDRFTEQLPHMLGSFAAPELVDLLRQQIEQISNQKHGGLLSLGFLGAIWSSSAAMVAIIGTLNRAYDIDEGRPWWKVRLTAIILTIGTAIFILVSSTLVLAGPELVDAVASRIGLGAASSGRGRSCSGRLLWHSSSSASN